jgi:hypothetical protein
MELKKARNGEHHQKTEKRKLRKPLATEARCRVVGTGQEVQGVSRQDHGAGAQLIGTWKDRVLHFLPGPASNCGPPTSCIAGIIGVNHHPWPLPSSCGGY